MSLEYPELRARALKGLTFFVVALAVLIFLPAWSLTFWQGWVYWLIFSAACLLITVYFLGYDPKLIESRLSAGASAETEKAQKTIQGVLSIFFILLFIVPGLDHRFGWSGVPAAAVIAADVLVAIGFLIIFFTFRANSYAAGTITLREGQRVISGGPYAIVRHPMYAGAVLLLAATPIALGSYWAELVFITILGGIAWRLLDEEAFLAKNLPGYAEYQAQTPYRLVPLIW
jgi:protein-S-isoprenylcysteine O-methyltransferase Ste14